VETWRYEVLRIQLEVGGGGETLGLSPSLESLYLPMKKGVFGILDLKPVEHSPFCYPVHPTEGLAHPAMALYISYGL